MSYINNLSESFLICSNDLRSENDSKLMINATNLVSVSYGVTDSVSKYECRK